MTNTKLLTEKIEASGFKKKYIAQRLKITYSGLQKKINNQSEFKSSELAELYGLLNIRSLKEREDIFFTKAVDK